jgi:membrane-associated phospholipid phosphatase
MDWKLFSCQHAGITCLAVELLTNSTQKSTGLSMTTTKTCPFLLCAALTALFALAPAAITHADDTGHKAAEFASGSGNIIYLAAAVGLPLISDGSNGQNHALRAADSIGTSVLISEGLKNLFKEKRPDSNSHDSFPSGHATAAFAAATAESTMHPKQAPYWYLGATLISLSRVAIHRHYWQDIIAGSLIGYGTAKWEMSEPRGLILSPLISRDSGGSGLQLSKSF